jgi:hypothetical protein
LALPLQRLCTSTSPIVHWNQSEIFRQNAENCAHLAETAANEPAFLRFKRMEAAWLALANEQDWLDGEVSPTHNAAASGAGDRAAGKAEQIDQVT